ncbi:hypothetical protein RFI_15283 [Reticulomyxa filosa]|uniref:RRM domain-containing protein n=1 Tax=Reticulomyxa filosa TaxID=46433 RepID=X6N860_RETFI|nr:hypothetical protein RFI_15283 [Reticulomyxa filosa]|eukprot:ETO21919.1 hypothetical protein RFI_15283 [Reticulomyxa filosa]
MSGVIAPLQLQSNNIGANFRKGKGKHKRAEEISLKIDFFLIEDENLQINIRYHIQQSKNLYSCQIDAFLFLQPLTLRSFSIELLILCIFKSISFKVPVYTDLLKQKLQVLSADMSLKGLHKYLKSNNKFETAAMSHRKEVDLDKLFSVMVFNISYQTRKEDLHKAFDKFGEVADIYIPKDTHGESRGFGFVRYYDRRDAEDALVVDGTLLDGRRVGVQMAKYGNTKLFFFFFL